MFLLSAQSVRLIREICVSLYFAGPRGTAPRAVQRVPMVQDKDGKQVASQEIEVEIAPNLRVTVLRETITSVIRPVAANDVKPVKDKAS